MSHKNFLSRRGFIGRLTFALLVLFGAATATAKQNISQQDISQQAGGRLTRAGAVVRAKRVLVIAHRGASNKAPENTLPAFRLAVKAGADLVELDYYHSADGVPMVFHDKHLDRTTNSVALWRMKKIPITSKTQAELEKLDAGSWLNKKYASTRIPTLSKSIDVIQPGSVTLIERKHGDAARCIRMLREKQCLTQVVVQAFDWKYLKKCSALAPVLVMAALGDKKITPERFAEIKQTGAVVIAWNADILDKATIAEIHRRGFRAWAYTVDDPNRAQKLIDDGIDGIITNVPGRMKKLVAEHKKAVATP